MDEETECWCFVWWFPQYAEQYGGNKTAQLLEEFFDAYSAHAKDIDDFWDDEQDRLLHIVSLKIQPELCDWMNIYYLQGCAKLIMEETGDNIAETVAGLVMRFWEDAACYHKKSELSEFYKNSFKHIGDCLLSIEEHESRKERKCMLKFIKSLTKK